MSMMIDVRRLSTFNKMAKEGAKTVAENLTQMTGTQAEMEITKLNFLEVADIEKHLGVETQVGVEIELTEPPHGSLLMLFDEGSASNLASLMMGGMGGGGHEFGEMEQSAVQEMGNIMASGFIDGWANVLGTTINMSTPTFYHCSGAEMVRQIVEGEEEEVAMVFDSHLHASDADISAKIYAFPDLEELVDLMNRLEI